VKRLLAVLLMATAAQAQEPLPDVAREREPGTFSEQHAREKQREGNAIGARMQQNLQAASDRDEVRYADNRRRCQAALEVAELCGKFAGTFYCNERGFQPMVPEATARPALNSSARHKMERCALDAADRPAPLR